MDELLTELSLEAYEQSPAEVIVDVDAMDDPLHGKQEGRIFHGYCRSYCYLPLYIILWRASVVCLRIADQDGAAGKLMN